MIRNLPLGKNAKGVASAVIDMLLPFKNFGAVKTITTDNGPEFAEHETISKKLDTSVFFADPEKKSASNCRSKNFIYICKSSCILVWNLSLSLISLEFLEVVLFLLSLQYDNLELYETDSSSAVVPGLPARG